MSKKLKILLIGGTGQLGREIIFYLNSLGKVWAPKRTELDLLDFDSLKKKIQTYKPNLILNLAAYTDVEKAEVYKQIAKKINSEAPKIIAEESNKINAILIHFSTDYVFDGNHHHPYSEIDKPNPLNIYGKTKLQGENFIKSSHNKYLIFRTGWVYSPFHGQNFYQKILKLLKNNEKIKVISDQIGAPTSVEFLSKKIIHVITHLRNKKDSEIRWGTYHLSEEKIMSWYQFARDIYKNEGYDLSQINHKIIPINSNEYKTNVKRPSYSVLDNTLINTKFFN